MTRERSFFAALFTTLAMTGADAMALETPEYKVLSQREGFEIREYAPHIVAETEVAGDGKKAGEEGFRRIAGYIFGANRERTKIAMTAPVTRQESVRIDMTAPVTRQGDAGRYTLRFMMPSSWTLDTLPVPNDPRVQLRQMPARRVAALSYSGSWSENRFRDHRERLEKALRENGLEPVGEPEWARYDPPWMPWFLKSNEVLIELSPAN